MTMDAKQSDLEIQAILRAEIRDLQKRHDLEIALLHATYAMAWNGPGEGMPTVEDQLNIIARSPLFDEGWYLAAYPDVAESGMPADEHYVRAGAFEGRNPGPDFDTMAYYLANPDVARAGWPALIHHAHFGQVEGRPLG
ncbi:hypothetical protein [Pelagerythrobacter sp.]|uniref:hypothetical protein n=1 Tax=Pelagerythrobacter sp. TaxID=2800702 RepID=UPI0035B28AA9